MFTSKKIVLSILAVSLIVPASVFAGNRSRWEQFVKRVEPYGKYIVPASLSIGAAAGLSYLAIPNNQSLERKISSAAAVSILSALASFSTLGMTYFGITESLD
jgi:hypothetical protein